jgi:Sterol-sensing domain of SREBP cleavage-activation
LRADDIFVFTTYYRSTLRLAPYFAIDTRLTQVFTASASACLATSTTSAFAFAANIFSPVPAIQSFGLLLAMLVIVNYVLAVTWFPVCLALWDRYIMLPSIRRAVRSGGGEGPPICGCIPRGLFFCCFEGDSAESRTSKVRSSYTAALQARKPVEPRVLEYGRIAWPFTAPPPMHRLARTISQRPPVIVPPPPGPVVAEEERSWWWRCRNNFFNELFDFTWRIRWLAILICLGIAVAGAIGTAQLKQPPTSEPPLFQSDHNVQARHRVQHPPLPLSMPWTRSSET